MQDEIGTYIETIPLQFLVDSALEKIPVANIGVGAAKEISFAWDKNNTERLVEFLTELNPDMSEFCSIGEKGTIFYLSNGVLLQADNPSDVSMMYMLSSDEDEYTIPIPAAYSILIHEIIKCGKFYNGDYYKGPFILLTVSYSDILGNEYQQQVLLMIKRLLFMQELDNSGKATYQIIPAYGR